MKVTVIRIVIGEFGSIQRIGTRTERFRKKKTSGDYPYYNINVIVQNTEKWSRDSDKNSREKSSANVDVKKKSDFQKSKCNKLEQKKV